MHLSIKCSFDVRDVYLFHLWGWNWNEKKKETKRTQNDRSYGKYI